MSPVNDAAALPAQPRATARPGLAQYLARWQRRLTAFRAIPRRRRTESEAALNRGEARLDAVVG
jgi:hypothetical protein